MRYCIVLDDLYADEDKADAHRRQLGLEAENKSTHDHLGKYTPT